PPGASRVRRQRGGALRMRRRRSRPLHGVIAAAARVYPRGAVNAHPSKILTLNGRRKATGDRRRGARARKSATCSEISEAGAHLAKQAGWRSSAPAQMGESRMETLKSIQRVVVAAATGL